MEQSQIDALAREAGLIQKEVNGKTYGIKLLPAMKGMSMGKRLIQAFAPALGVLMDSNPGDAELFGTEQSVCTDIAIAIVQQLDELEFEKTVYDLLVGTSCNGVLINFDDHFKGNYGTLLFLIEFALKENFGDFFTEWLKAKGLSIHTLKSMMMPTLEDSSSKSKEE